MDGNNMIKARRNQEYYLVLLVGMCVATEGNKKLVMSRKHTDENNMIKAGQNHITLFISRYVCCNGRKQKVGYVNKIFL